MPDREKMKVEFIESYWTGGEFGSDYKWNDNHGELIRCKDCRHGEPVTDEDGEKHVFCMRENNHRRRNPEWFCADGERKD